MPTVKNVSAGKPKVAGAVYRAPLGTTLPTDATTALVSAFADMGYISEDGIVNSNSPETEKIKAWGGQIVLVVSTEKPDTIKLTFLESLNANVLKTVYGDTKVTVDDTNHTITVAAGAAALEDNGYAIDISMRGGALKRTVIPRGELSELGDIVYKDDEAVGYEVTLECMPDSSGNTHYEYIKLATSST